MFTVFKPLLLEMMDDIQNNHNLINDPKHHIGNKHPKDELYQ